MAARPDEDAPPVLCFHVFNLGDIWSKKRLLAPKLCLAVLFHNRNAACLRLKAYLCIDFRWKLYPFYLLTI